MDSAINRDRRLQNLSPRYTRLHRPADRSRREPRRDGSREVGAVAAFVKLPGLERHARRKINEVFQPHSLALIQSRAHQLRCRNESHGLLNVFKIGDVAIQDGGVTRLSMRKNKLLRLQAANAVQRGAETAQIVRRAAPNFRNGMLDRIHRQARLDLGYPNGKMIWRVSGRVQKMQAEIPPCSVMLSPLKVNVGDTSSTS